MRVRVLFLIIILLNGQHAATAQDEEIFQIEPNFSKIIGSDGFDHAFESQRDSEDNLFLTGSFSYPLYDVPGSYPGPLYEGPFYDRDDNFQEYPVIGENNSHHYGGEKEIPFTKFNKDHSIAYSKYFGGNKSDEARAVKVSGDLVLIGGTTSSSSFYGMEQFNHSGKYDGFYMTINKTTGMKIKIDTIGGSEFDFIEDIGVLSDGSIIVVGTTTSRDFPTKRAFDTTLVGAKNSSDVFLTKIRKDGSHEFSTYFGGTGSDLVRKLQVDDNDNIIIGGFTLSDDIPVVNAPYNASNGQTDGFLATIDKNGSLIKSSYFGGSNTDIINDIKLMPNGNIMIVGMTFSEDFPITKSIPGIDTTINVYEDDEVINDAFYTLLDNDYNVIFSSFLGGSSGDVLQGIDVDKDGDFYLVGYTKSPNFPIHGNFTRPPEFNGELLDEASEGLKQFDLTLTKITSQGRIAYSIFYGSFSVDAAYDLDVKKIGNKTLVTVAGYSSSANFPITEPIIGGKKLDGTFLIQFEVPGGIYDQVAYPGKDRTVQIITLSTIGVLTLLGLITYFYKKYKRKQELKESHHDYREKYDLIKEAMKEE